MSRLIPSLMPALLPSMVGGKQPSAPWEIPDDYGSAGGTGPVNGDPNLYALTSISGSNYYLSAANVGFAGNAAAVSFVYIFRKTGSVGAGIQVPFAVREPTPTLGYNFQIVSSLFAAGASVPTLGATGGDNESNFATGAVHMIVGTAGAGASNLQYYRNGNAVGAPVGGGSYVPANASRKVSIGVDTSATLPAVNQDIIAVGSSSTVLSAGQVAALWTAFQSRRDLTPDIFPGAQNIWSVKTNNQSVAASWADSVGGAVVSKVGTPTLAVINSPVWGT